MREGTGETPAPGFPAGRQEEGSRGTAGSVGEVRGVRPGRRVGLASADLRAELEGTLGRGGAGDAPRVPRPRAMDSVGQAPSRRPEGRDACTRATSVPHGTAPPSTCT